MFMMMKNFHTYYLLRLKLKLDGIWGWDIHDLNGWDIYGLDGWGSYSKLGFWGGGDMLKTLEVSTLSGHCMTTGFGPFELPSLTIIVQMFVYL